LVAFVKDVIKREKQCKIGVVTVRPDADTSTAPTLQSVFSVGTLGQVVRLSQVSEETVLTYRMLVKGLQAFEIKKIETTGPCLKAQVSFREPFSVTLSTIEEALLTNIKVCRLSQVLSCLTIVD
jgi:ATP-dependent Lon protease